MEQGEVRGGEDRGAEIDVIRNWESEDVSVPGRGSKDVVWSPWEGSEGSEGSEGCFRVVVHFVF